MSKLLTWWLLLNKRLFKKPAFLAILMLVPILSFAISATSKQDSGVLKILLTAEGGGDAAANEMIDSLLESESIILFSRADSADAALRAVKSAEADAVWIFPADTSKKIAEYLANPGDDKAFITVLQREQTTMLALSVEKIAQAAFPHVADDIYLAFIRQNVPSLAHKTDSELLSFYNNILEDVELFSFDNTVSAREEGGFLAGPLRGLISVLIVLGGLAAAIYFFKDEEAGTFAMLSIPQRRLVASATQQSALCWVALAGFIALALSGQWLGFGIELASMIIYIFAVAGFCTLLRRICGSGNVLAAICPLCVVVLIAICPVFFQQTALRHLQLLLPPYYYLTSLHNPIYILYMAAYGGALWGVCALLSRIGRKI